MLKLPSYIFCIHLTNGIIFFLTFAFEKLKTKPNNYGKQSDFNG